MDSISYNRKTLKTKPNKPDLLQRFAVFATLPGAVLQQLDHIFGALYYGGFNAQPMLQVLDPLVQHRLQVQIVEIAPVRGQVMGRDHEARLRVHVVFHLKHFTVEE